LASGSQIEMIRSLRSWAISPKVSRRPEPVGAEEVVVDDELTDRDVVERHPDGAAPVRVTTEHGGGRLGGLVVDPGVGQAFERVRAPFVALRYGSEPVRREERVFGEELREALLELVRIDHRQQHRLVSSDLSDSSCAERPAALGP
jgi:hypothetical protein